MQHERLFDNLHYVNYRSTPKMTSNTCITKRFQQGAAKNFKSLAYLCKCLTKIHKGMLYKDHDDHIMYTNDKFNKHFCKQYNDH